MGKKKNKELYVHVAWLDHVLTLSFLTLVFLTCWSLDNKNLMVLLGYMVVTMIGIRVTKAACKKIACVVGMPKAVSKPRNVRKFADQGWQLMIHLCMAFLELVVMQEDGWSMWTNTNNLWVDNIPIPSRIQTLYLAQWGIWFWTAASHRFLEARHKDYFVMYAHHVVTLALLLGSYSFGFTKVGSLVLLVHDVSDIFVDSLKMLNYLGLDESSGTYLVEICFVTNLVMWAVFRLFYFPFKIIASCFSEARLICDESVDATNFEILRIGHPPCTMLRVFLLMLVAMHIWWYYLFWRIAVKLVLGKNAHTAGRDEYEGQSSDSEAETHAKNS